MTRWTAVQNHLSEVFEIECDFQAEQEYLIGQLLPNENPDCIHVLVMMQFDVDEVKAEGSGTNNDSDGTCRRQSLYGEKARI